MQSCFHHFFGPSPYSTPWALPTLMYFSSYPACLITTISFHFHGPLLCTTPCVQSRDMFAAVCTMVFVHFSFVLPSLSKLLTASLTSISFSLHNLIHFLIQKSRLLSHFPYHHPCLSYFYFHLCAYKSTNVLVLFQFRTKQLTYQSSPAHMLFAFFHISRNTIHCMHECTNHDCESFLFPVEVNYPQEEH